MFDPKVILVLVAIGTGSLLYQQAVKPAAVKVAHVSKAVAKKIGHIFHK